jgi:hypothetical protein
MTAAQAKQPASTDDGAASAGALRDVGALLMLAKDDTPNRDEDAVSDEEGPALKKEPRTRKPWDEQEDAALKALVTELGVGRWADLARKMGTVRTGKQCRERWHNHLSPAVDKNEWREEEDQIIAEGVARLGPKCASAPEVGAGCTFITPLVDCASRF